MNRFALRWMSSIINEFSIPRFGTISFFFEPALSTIKGDFIKNGPYKTYVPDYHYTITS